MNAGKPKYDNQLTAGKSCSYQPPHCRPELFDPIAEACLCAPSIDLQQCPCAGLSNRWSKESLAKRNRHPKQRGLVAYLRASETGQDVLRQRKVIEDFCMNNEYYIKATFIDHGKPGAGLQDAMQALEDCDGLIASDLNRFVEHDTDRLRDLRPFVHHFFCQSSKHLISVEEGIDTGSSSGQTNAMELVSQLKEPF